MSALQISSLMAKPTRRSSGSRAYSKYELKMHNTYMH